MSKFSEYVEKRIKFLKEKKNMSDNKNFTIDPITPNHNFKYDPAIIQQFYNAILNRSPSVTIPVPELEVKTTEDGEWVWVTGYKGLDKDMKAHGGFQYEMGKQYIMDDGKVVEACRSGFHLCLSLEDLYNYKGIGSGNRFFECKALVRVSDRAKYGSHDSRFFSSSFKIDKLAAKAIEITRELTADEILAHETDIDKWPEYVKEMAISEGIEKAKKEIKIRTLVQMGYARPLAEYIINDRNSEDGFKLAMALDAQPDISMDTKITAIFSHI